MSRKLDDLDPKFKPLAMELLARCAEAQIPCMIIGTGRTPEEQAENIKKGVSWTKNSLHLKGLAIDICPYDEFKASGLDKLLWDGNNPLWVKIGEIGEKIGLTWGGRWAQKDLGHFQWTA